MPQTRTLRTISATLGTATLVALSLSAGPALAADAPWSAPVEIADASNNNTSTVVAPDGTITLVTDSSAGIVTSSSTDAGLTWAPSVLTGSGGDSAFRPAVGVTSSGLLAVTWVQTSLGVRSILVAVSSDGGANWGKPRTLPTVSNEIDDPVVASTSATSFTIVWNEGNFDKYSTSSVDSGVTWSPAEVVTENLNSFSKATLVPTGDGEIVVIFQEFEGLTGVYSIQSKRSTDGGAAWGPKVLVSSEWSGSLGNGRYTYGASPADGTLVAVWSRGVSNDPDLASMFATTSTDGGASWATEFPVGEPASGLRSFTVRAISSTAVGIVWYYQTADGSPLSYSTVTVGETAATTPVTITTSPTDDFSRLPAFSSLGDVRVASWFDYRGEEGEEGFRTSVSCDAGATWSAPAVLAIGPDVYREDAQTAVSGETFVALWGQETSGPSGQSLFASTLSVACGLVIPTVPTIPTPTLAATGAPIVPTAILAFVIVTLGAGLLVVGRRSKTAVRKTIVAA
jgi:hypothetical protein